MNQLTETLKSMNRQPLTGNTAYGDYQFSQNNCKRFGCPNLSSGKFPCCDMTCGVKHRDSIKDLISYQTPPFYNFKDFYKMKDWTLEKVEYYNRLISNIKPHVAPTNN